MYIQPSWHLLRVSCHYRNVQYIPSTCVSFFEMYYFCCSRRSISSSSSLSSHKVFVKPAVEKFKTSIPEKSIKIQNSNNQNECLPNQGISYVPKPVVSLENISITDFKTSKVKWKEISLDFSKLGHNYLKLSKFRLTSLVIMTSMIGYAMSPSPIDLVSFVSCCIGTGLVSSAANSINQFLEVPFDAQMCRTRNRVLVQCLFSPLHAVGFAAVTGSVGLLLLSQGANNLTAILGASNLLLYTMIYTPLKRISILNTWVGSVVGAIPPLMGWAACEGSLNAEAFILGGILYAWQFPHFNALSWNLRQDYSKAGYRMMAVTDPELCKRTALRYTIAITLGSFLTPVCNFTHWSFAALSLPVNLYFNYLAFKFFKQPDSGNSRKLFRFSLAHLPFLMGLMLVTKQGLFSFSHSEVNEKKNSIFLPQDSGILIKNMEPPIEEKSYPACQVLHLSG